MCCACFAVSVEPHVLMRKFCHTELHEQMALLPGAAGDAHFPTSWWTTWRRSSQTRDTQFGGQVPVNFLKH